MKILTDHTVLDVQKALVNHGYSIAIDGISGPKTINALVNFQKKFGLLADGIVGTLTAEKLFDKPDVLDTAPKQKRLSFKRVLVDKYSDGYETTTLREDLVESFIKVRDFIRAAGGKITSSGGRRFLSAAVGPNRSKRSLHYLGRAHDLFVQSGMLAPTVDPYVVHISDEMISSWNKNDNKHLYKHFDVYARVKDGPEITLNGFTYNHEIVPVTGNFINLTEVMISHGWYPIPPRITFWMKKSRLASEWWHYQSLPPEGATFGEELLKVYPISKLRNSPVWQFRNSVWKGSTWH